MFLPRPIHPYYFHADLIWWDGPFMHKTFKGPLEIITTKKVLISGVMQYICPSQGLSIDTAFKVLILLSNYTKFECLSLYYLREPFMNKMFKSPQSGAGVGANSMRCVIRSSFRREQRGFCKLSPGFYRKILPREKFSIKKTLIHNGSLIYSRINRVKSDYFVLKSEEEQNCF
jgi:hypothetical protein